LVAYAPAQLDVVWTGAVNDDMFLDANWSPPIVPFAQNLIFNNVAIRGPRFAPPEGQPTFVANHVLMDNGFNHTFEIKATPQRRILEPPGSEQQFDEAAVVLLGNLTVRSGTLLIEDSTFIPATTAGEIRTGASITAQGNINLEGGAIRLRHLTVPDSFDGASALVSAQGNFNWSGGSLDFVATQATNDKLAAFNVGGDWNQSTPSFSLLGDVGRVSLTGIAPRTSQTINGSPGLGGFAVFPTLAIAGLPTTVSSGSQLYISSNISETALAVAQPLTFEGRGSLSQDTLQNGGIGLANQGSLILGDRRRLSLTKDIIQSSGIIDLSGFQSAITTPGTYRVAAAEALFPPLQLKVPGPSNTFYVGGWAVRDNLVTGNFIANFHPNCSFAIAGGVDPAAEIVQVGASQITWPSTLYIGPQIAPFSHLSKTWAGIGNAGTNLPNVTVIPGIGSFPAFQGGVLRHGNTDVGGENLNIPYFSVNSGTRVSITDGRVIAPTAGEIYNRGRISLSGGGDMKRPTKSLMFVNTSGSPVSSYIINQDDIVVIIEDSDKNFDGAGRDFLPANSSRLQIISGGNVVDEEVFNNFIGGHPHMSPRERGDYNYQFSNSPTDLVLRTKEAPAIFQDGKLSAIGGDGVRLIYQDPNGSGGPEVIDGGTFNPDDGGGGEPPADPVRAELMVTEFGVTVGGDIRILATVQNIGSAPAGAFQMGGWFDEVFDVTPGQTPDATVNVSGLAIGESKSVQIATSMLPPGTYNAWVAADSAGAIVETDETGNLVGPVSYVVPEAPFIDLRVDGVEINGQGQGALVSVSVSNLGNTSAAPSVLSITRPNGAPVTVTSPIIGGGATVILEKALTQLPVTSFQSTATIDANNEIVESDEGNNSLTSGVFTTTTVTPGMGQRMTFSSSRADNVPVELDKMDLFGETDGTTQFDRQFPKNVQTVTASVPANFAGSSFLGWINGQDNSLLSFEPQVTLQVVDGRTVRAVYGNSVPPRPDLVVDVFLAEASGPNLGFQVKVTNLGNLASGACEVGILLNRRTIPSNGTGDLFTAVSPLSPGQSQTLFMTFFNATVDIYRPVAFVDRNNVVVESAENNNTSLLTDGNGTLDFSSGNGGGDGGNGGGDGGGSDEGGGDTSGGPGSRRRVFFQSALVDNVPIVVDSFDVLGRSSGNTSFNRLYSRSTDFLSVTAPASHQGSAFIRWFDPAGAGTIVSTNRTTTAEVWDGRKLVAEYSANGGNPKPDLTIDFLNAQVLGNAILFDARVRNQGNAGSAACDLALFYNATFPPTNGSGANQIASIPALGPGASAQIGFLWQNVAPGSYSPWAFADGQLVVDESAENNNAIGLGIVGNPNGGTTGGDNPGNGNGGGGSGGGNGGGSDNDDPDNGNGGGSGGGGIDVGDGSGGSGGGNNPGGGDTGGGVGGGLTGYKTVTFTSALASNVPITIVQFDGAGNLGGSTNFTRSYMPATDSINVTAPATVAEGNFVRWFNATSSAVISTNASTTINLADGQTYRAEYDGSGLPGGIGGGPDLVVDDLRVVVTPTQANFFATVRNVGGQSASGSTLGIYADRGGPPAQSDAPTFTISVPTIAAGASVEVSSGPVNVATIGFGLAWAYADQTSTVSELVEGNNVSPPQRYFTFQPTVGVKVH